MVDRSKKTHEIIETKNKEIKELQERIQLLLSSSPKTSDHLKFYDQNIKRAEEEVKKYQDITGNYVIPELIKKDKVDKIIEQFSKRMEKIEDEVKNKVMVMN